MLRCSRAATAIASPASARPPPITGLSAAPTGGRRTAAAAVVAAAAFEGGGGSSSTTMPARSKRSFSVPALCSARRSSQPPMCSPPTKICGSVDRPARDSISSSLERSTLTSYSSYATSRALRNVLARVQYAQPGVV